MLGSVHLYYGSADYMNLVIVDALLMEKIDISILGDTLEKILHQEYYIRWHKL
jgi:hypothetical protein